MANSVKELLDELYTMIDEARGGLGGTCKIDRNKALDILDEVNQKFPAEVKEGQNLIQKRNQYLDEAQRDAEQIRRQAEEQARRMVDQSELVTQMREKQKELYRETAARNEEMLNKANAEAKETVRKAEERSEELRQVANEYCEDALRRTEEALSEAMNEVHQSRSRFRNLAGMGAVAADEVPAKPAVYDAEKDNV